MATTYEESRDAISALVLSAWNTATGSALLTYDNLDEDRPEGVVWGRLTVRHTGGGRASLGSNSRFRRTGTVFIQIFVPKNTGMQTADAIGEALAKAFDDAGQIGNLWFRDVAMKEVGPDTDLTHFQTNVEAGFTFDRVT